MVELQRQLKTQQEKIVAIENSLTKAEDKVEALRQDYHFVSHEKTKLEGQLKQKHTDKRTKI